jgi:hypothetical protein
VLADRAESVLDPSRIDRAHTSFAAEYALYPVSTTALPAATV